MSDVPSFKKEDPKPAPAAQGPVIVLTVNEKGQIQISGPLVNKELCMQMLSGGMQAVLSYNNPGGQPPMSAQPGFMQTLKNNLKNIGRRKK